MKPQVLLGTARVPGDAAELKLYRHDRDYMFCVDRTELMTSRAHGSEEELAELALARLADCSSARVLIGGLGMGYTLARVLSLVGDAAVANVVELVPEVVAWNRQWLGELNGHPLKDPRVRVLEGDVAQQLREAGRSDSADKHDVILLDVDNGPQAITRPANNWLYSPDGLLAARAALRRGGVLAVWSSDYQTWFTERLRKVGFVVSEERVHARRTVGPMRTIWVAQLA